MTSETGLSNKSNTNASIPPVNFVSMTLMVEEHCVTSDMDGVSDANPFGAINCIVALTAFFSVNDTKVPPPASTPNVKEKSAEQSIWNGNATIIISKVVFSIFS